MKKSKLNTNDRKALYVGGVVICMAVFYFLGWHVFHNDTVQIKEENTQLEAKLTQLEQKESQRDQVLAETDQYNAETQKIVAEFPERVTTEKIISDIVDMEGETGGSRVTSVTFTMNNLFYPQSDAASTDAADAADADTSDDVKGYEDGVITVYQSQAALSIVDLSYAGLKKLVDYTNAYDGRLTIDSLSMQFDSQTGDLAGSVTLNFYSLDGSPTKYQEPKITDVELGLENLFGTFESSKKSK